MRLCVCGCGVCMWWFCYRGSEYCSYGPPDVEPGQTHQTQRLSLLLASQVCWFTCTLQQLSLTPSISSLSPSSSISSLSRSLLESSLAQTNLLLSHLKKAGIPIVWHGRLAGEPAPYCNNCVVSSTSEPQRLNIVCLVHITNFVILLETAAE